MKLTKKFLDAMKITRGGQGFYIWHAPDELGGDIELFVSNLEDGEIKTFEDLVYSIYKTGDDDRLRKIKNALNLRENIDWKVEELI